MKIKHVEVIKLNGRYNYSVDFHSDINIITGLNGSGKSTFVKLIWYMISGNLERIPREIEVSSALVVTDLYSIRIELSGSPDKDSRIRGRHYRIQFKSKEHERDTTLSLLRLSSESELEEINRYIGETSGSLFFPTYRRVEWGGASDENRRTTTRRAIYGEESALEVITKTLDRVSKEISVFNHTFVTSTSVDDIIALLTDRYANVSRTNNYLQNKLSERIILQIESHNDDGSSSSNDVMQSIKKDIENTNQRRDRLMMPFSKFTELATSVLGDKKVKLTKFLSVGNETSEEVPAYLLSAGEKQMISFLCYNALLDNIPIIIDEPELSLHTDWQRILFPLLLSQDTKNQFIAVTHSPFIYAKYSDREVIFNKDRGNSDDPADPGFLKPNSLKDINE